MRHFSLDLGNDRKFVVIELRGPVMRVVQGKSDGLTRKTEKELASEAQARLAADRMAGELVSRGYVEQISSPVTAPSTRAPAVSRSPAPVPRPGPLVMARVVEAEAVDEPHEADESHDGLDLDTLAGAVDGRSAEAATLLPRMTAASTTATATEAAAKPKKKKANARAKKKKKQGGSSGDHLDKRVIAGFVSLVLACIGFLGNLGYDAFLKPPTIVGHWEGTRLEHEKGKFLTRMEYQLILDGDHNATMTVERSTSAGTYVFKGNQLLLTFKDEEGEVSETAYQVSLGRATLDLYEPGGDKKIVELIRFRAKSAALATARAKPVEAPKDLGAAPADPANDAKLVSVDFFSKDAAFRLKRPPSWEVESGSRPDNTYSWARFTRDSAKVQVYADIAGSLMAGSNQGNYEEGSDLAPVHKAHELYKRQATEDHTDYVESEPTLFKGSSLGEGRIATFTASSGLFGSKLQGVRITFLTNDRRVSILCEAPASQFSKYQPTFLALARSLGR